MEWVIDTLMKRVFFQNSSDFLIMSLSGRRQVSSAWFNPSLATPPKEETEKKCQSKRAAEEVNGGQIHTHVPVWTGFCLQSCRDRGRTFCSAARSGSTAGSHPSCRGRRGSSIDRRIWKHWTKDGSKEGQINWGKDNENDHSCLTYEILFTILKIHCRVIIVLLSSGFQNCLMVNHLTNISTSCHKPHSVINYLIFQLLWWQT